jgi:hypothetical protein
LKALSQALMPISGEALPLPSLAWREKIRARY